MATGQTKEERKIFYGITEFVNGKACDEIPIHIYTIPIRNIDKKHSENYAVVKHLKKINKENKCISFFEFIVASFEKINNWGDIKYSLYENRCINCKVPAEREILERLLIEDIKCARDKDVYGVYQKSICEKIPCYLKNNISMKRKFDFDVDVGDSGKIIIGCDMSHTFEYINALDKDIENNSVLPGDKVKDIYYDTYYNFKKLAPFAIGEFNEYMKCSIVEYYKNKGEEYIIYGLSNSTKVVLVENSSGMILPYIANRLKRVCNFENLNGSIIRQCNQYMKPDTNTRMKCTIDACIDITNKCRYVLFNKRDMLADRIGYKISQFACPKLVFGNSNTHTTPLYGMSRFGSYERAIINISYYIDSDIFNDEIEYEFVKKTMKDMEQYSLKLGIPIKRISSGVDFKSITMQNKDIFENELRYLVDNYKVPTIVIMTDEHSQNYYNTIKKVFGNKNNIPTQMVELSTLKNVKKDIDSIFTNILLGVYCKSEIQPWVLKEPLSADCFVGLDVSRENDVNMLGVVQIVGRDGRILKSKTVTSAQAGEKIKIDTIKEILQDAKDMCTKIYGKVPNRIVFHRDGINREEVKALESTAKNIGVKIDYVEITKQIPRRIATFYKDKLSWQTEIGMCYISANTAYMVTTKPYIGMARPLRIRKISGDLPIESIVKDIYKLSFMHIASTQKSRLPITTHYADLSSTYGNREWMPNYIDAKALHFV